MRQSERKSYRYMYINEMQQKIKVEPSLLPDLKVSWPTLKVFSLSCSPFHGGYFFYSPQKNKGRESNLKSSYFGPVSYK